MDNFDYLRETLEGFNLIADGLEKIDENMSKVIKPELSEAGENCFFVMAQFKKELANLILRYAVTVDASKDELGFEEKRTDVRPWTCPGCGALEGQLHKRDCRSMRLPDQPKNKW
jgi:hypothetical protein